MARPRNESTAKTKPNANAKRTKRRSLPIGPPAKTGCSKNARRNATPRASICARGTTRPALNSTIAAYSARIIHSKKRSELEIEPRNEGPARMLVSRSRSNS
ncbi:hypothetical protein PGTUg99_023265 [Puccinia graminis f. sp. tritici]|uniref:Uncharacterized protein n=1 Tax=Puccinia graminis f. sp. tritici TaxID=56615 RepID=A0A5B0MHM2_PUCGR|nr:hypothetical protein PGTUg99_023265 [Puccinia graminis f. sp. tritici]